MPSQKKMKYAKLVLLSLVIVFMQSCSSKSLTSPYFRPEPGAQYRYGNFCGDGHPAGQDLLGQSERIDMLQRIKPVDSIDLICQMHDLCYARTFNDNIHCDNMIGQLIGSRGFDAWDGSNRIEGQCRNIEMEILIAFNTYFKRNRDGQPEFLSNLYFSLGATSVALVSPVIAYSASIYGFPQEGQCHLRGEALNARLERARPNYVLALAINEALDACPDRSFPQFQQCTNQIADSLESEITTSDMR